MPQATAHFEKWDECRAARAAEHREACLPYAGGSASFFFPVIRALHPSVEVLAFQYPGRQTRLHELRIDNIPEFADQIFAALQHLDDKPLALFGHSMGTVLGYEVALRIQDAGLTTPVRLFASGRRALSRYGDERVHTASDAELVAEIRTLSGTNEMLRGDPEVLAMILPAIRSDYTAIERYRHEPGRRLNCPVTMLTGDRAPGSPLMRSRPGRGTPPGRVRQKSSGAATSSSSTAWPRSLAWWPGGWGPSAALRHLARFPASSGACGRRPSCGRRWPTLRRPPGPCSE
ncbi:thioesterase II family protein [Streptomyces pseudovenezuelae]|uniref:Surfactin synthase thioesterase subunit n=1 Tax=Streptomyces pseudovenezuelae TaxID=67350 RepID=A0ABT6M385_9ACTN|nr:alpha/beta fold hydrolase [Streptomyces pseudovenezuelae]MDH6222988.1 surfactin synthase thioesterase subunit [Streptomyces pseudovenezuelae]